MVDAVVLPNSSLVRQHSPSEPTCLVDAALFALGGSIPADGRISWYSHEHLGRYVPFNSYLLREGGNLLLLESGVPAVFGWASAQLRGLLGPRPEIDRLVVTRNEPDCVANIPQLVRHFGLKTVHSPGLMNTLQFFPADEAGPESSFHHRSTELQMLNFGVSCVPAVSGGEVEIAEDRPLEIIAVPLRVLPTVWYYDRTTKTMFCSDSFSDETAATPDTRVISSVDERDVLVARFRRHFLGKFDWLMRSDLSSIIVDLERIFGHYEVEVLAPSRGLVVQGRSAVEAKMAALLAALKAL